jgi:hypothetical protein
VCLYLVKGRSIFAIKLEQAHNEILKVLRKIVAVNFLPVKIRLSGVQQVVEVLFGASFFEGENSLHNDKADHCE